MQKFFITPYVFATQFWISRSIFHFIPVPANDYRIKKKSTYVPISIRPVYGLWFFNPLFFKSNNLIWRTMTYFLLFYDPRVRVKKRFLFIILAGQVRDFLSAPLHSLSTTVALRNKNNIWNLGPLYFYLDDSRFECVPSIFFLLFTLLGTPVYFHSSSPWNVKYFRP